MYLTDFFEFRKAIVLRNSWAILTFNTTKLWLLLVNCEIIVDSLRSIELGTLRKGYLNCPWPHMIGVATVRGVRRLDVSNPWIRILDIWDVCRMRLRSVWNLAYLRFFLDITSKICNFGLLPTILYQKTVRGQAIRNPNIFPIDIILNLAVSIDEAILLINSVFKILREATLFCFSFDYLQDIVQHHLFLLLSCLFILMCRCDLQNWSFCFWMIECKVLVEPHSNFTVSIDSHHRVSYFKKTYLLIAFLKTSQGLA